MKVFRFVIRFAVTLFNKPHNFMKIEQYFSFLKKILRLSTVTIQDVKIKHHVY